MNSLGEEGECEKYPCFRLGIDHRRKRFAVFLVTSDGVYTYVPVDRIREALKAVEGLEHKHYREAVGDEVDEIAVEILGLASYEEEE